jgi:hypothetical protein
MAGQLLAAALVIGCYFAPRFRITKLRRSGELVFQEPVTTPINETEPEALEPAQSAK